MKLASILLLGIGIVAGAQNVPPLGASRPIEPPQVAQLLAELPQCSILRTQLANRQYGSGIEQPYMKKMLLNGVKRAEIDVDSVWNGKKPTNLVMVSQNYFSQYDGPDSQISDPVALKEIEASGLPEVLYSIARDRVLKAKVWRGPDPRLWFPKKKVSIVEFLANPWLQEDQVRLYPRYRSKMPNDLYDVATADDANRTAELLRLHNFKKQELDRALFFAAISRYDNTTVINMLVRAGADPNVHNSDGDTPLMAAVARPCNIQPLVSVGVPANARNKSGLTALDIARQQKVVESIRLLEAAAPKPSRKSMP